MLSKDAGQVERWKKEKRFSAGSINYLYKVEVSVLPNRLAIGCSEHYPGSVADIDIMRKMEEFHIDDMSKTDEEMDIADVRILCKNYENSRGLLADKRYQGSGEFLTSVIQRRNPVSGHLTLQDEAQNKKIS